MYGNTNTTTTTYVASRGPSAQAHPQLRPNRGPFAARNATFSSHTSDGSYTPIGAKSTFKAAGPFYPVNEEIHLEPARKSRQRYASSASQSSLSSLSSLPASCFSSALSAQPSLSPSSSRSSLSSLSPSSSSSSPSPSSTHSALSAPSPLTSVSSYSSPSPPNSAPSTVSTSSRRSARSVGYANSAGGFLHPLVIDEQLCTDYYQDTVVQNARSLTPVMVDTPGLPSFPARVIEMGGSGKAGGTRKLVSLYGCGLRNARDNMMRPDECVFACEPWNQPIIIKITWPRIANAAEVCFCFDIEKLTGTSRDELTRETLGSALALAYHNLTINHLHAICDESCDCGVDGFKLSHMLVGDIFLDAIDGTWNANIFLLQQKQ